MSRRTEPLLAFPVPQARPTRGFAFWLLAEMARVAENGTEACGGVCLYLTGSPFLRDEV